MLFASRNEFGRVKLTRDTFRYPDLHYLGVNLSGIISGKLEAYLESLSWQGALIKYLDKYLDYSPKRKLIVCRDRRHMEHIWLQVSRNKGIATRMWVHGMLTSNYDKTQLFTSNYEFIDKVMCWGSQQQEAISKKQKV